MAAGLDNAAHLPVAYCIVEKEAADASLDQASGRSSGSACVVQEDPHLPFHLKACCESVEVGEGHSDSSLQDP